MKCKISSWNLKNKIVIVRADLNVPLFNGTILNDFRLKAICPTLDLILKQGGRIVLISHLGRPEHNEQEFSLQQLIPWFIERNYAIDFAATTHDALQKSAHQQKDIILLENVRFFAGEKEHTMEFVRSLAALGDYYVNDAWGALQRKDASITLVPTFFEPNQKSIGLLVAAELAALKKCLKPRHPYVIILGGGKVKDKLPLLRDLLITDVDTIVIGPALVFTLLKSRGHNVGTSFVEPSLLSLAQECIDFAHERSITIIYPVDYVVAHQNLESELKTVLADDFNAHDNGITMGPKTVELLKPTLLAAKTIVVAGMMGLWSRPETLEPFGQLLRIVAACDAYRVIAGGDSVAAAEKFSLASQFDHCSTGGGSTLNYISYKELPGLISLEK